MNQGEHKDLYPSNAKQVKSRDYKSVQVGLKSKEGV